MECHFSVESLIKCILETTAWQDGAVTGGQRIQSNYIVLKVYSKFWLLSFEKTDTHVYHVSKGNKIKIITTRTFPWITILAISHNLSSVLGVLKFKVAILKVHLSESWEIVPEVLPGGEEI